MVAVTTVKVKTASGWQDLSVAVPGSVAIEPWHAVGGAGEPAFQNSWVNDTLGGPLAFRKTPDGRVYVRGAIKSGTDGSTVFVLPVGYRPSYVRYFDTLVTGGASGAYVAVATDGAMTLGRGAAVTVYVDLSFETDQASFPTGPSGADTAPRVIGALPTPMYDGQEIVYVADAVNGVLWRLRYNGASASAYKWEYLGGPPLKQFVAASTGAIGVTGYAVMGGGPSFALPLSGDYDVGFGAFMSPNMANYGQIAAAFPPAATSNDDCIQVYGDSGGEAGDREREIRKTGLTAGNLVQLHMLVPAGTMTCTRRLLWVRPVRVG